MKKVPLESIPLFWVCKVNVLKRGDLDVHSCQNKEVEKSFPKNKAFPVLGINWEKDLFLVVDAFLDFQLIPRSGCKKFVWENIY